jgi:hypothetical protein
MLVDTFRGRKLELNDVITYRCSVPTPLNANAPRQHKENGPYTGRIVDFTNRSICVRSDGLMGKEPLYHVSIIDVICVEQSLPIDR